MNLRCLYCQTPFTLSRAEMLAALILMEEKNHNHYDAHCPRCRRANSISRERMQLFYPNWKQDAAKPRAVVEEPAAPAPAAEVKPAAEKKPAAKKPAAAAKKTTAKPAAEKKPAAKKPAAKTSAEKKPAAKKTTSTTKKK